MLLRYVEFVVDFIGQVLSFWWVFRWVVLHGLHAQLRWKHSHVQVSKWANQVCVCVMYVSTLVVRKEMKEYFMIYWLFVALCRDGDDDDDVAVENAKNYGSWTMNMDSFFFYNKLIMIAYLNPRNVGIMTWKLEVGSQLGARRKKSQHRPT